MSSTESSPEVKSSFQFVCRNKQTDAYYQGKVILSRTEQSTAIFK